MTQVALTTIDNPYNPITEFDDWNNYDLRNGYNTLALVARLVNTSDEETEEMIHQDYENAIDDILTYVDSEFYKKVTADI